MKSKVQFDLNGLNQAVISAKIANTEDVRDKVAKSFSEGFGYESILATVYHVNSTTWRDEDGAVRTIAHVEIRPVRVEQSQNLAMLLGDNHLRALSDALLREIAFRKRTGCGSVPYDYDQSPIGVIRDYSVEDTCTHELPDLKV